MKLPVYTLYHGESLSMRDLERRFGISDTTLTRWHREGRLCEATVDRHLALREERRRTRELGRANGVKDATRRMRVSRGWSREAAALDWSEVLP